jgi:hypothetical protein
MSYRLERNSPSTLHIRRDCIRSVRSVMEVSNTTNVTLDFTSRLRFLHFAKATMVNVSFYLIFC